MLYHTQSYTPVEEQQESFENAVRIFVRPEIRKGCIWDIQFNFSPVVTLNQQQIYVEDPKGPPESLYLTLKVRSKLIRPIREVPFSKVADVVNSDEPLEISNGMAVLRAKFTARPRSVFHKHSDMMLLIATLKRGNQELSVDMQELIFRGGTGSVHSAGNRKRKLLKQREHKTPQTTSWAQNMDIYPEVERMNASHLLSNFMQNNGNMLVQQYDQNIMAPMGVPMNVPFQDTTPTSPSYYEMGSMYQKNAMNDPMMFSNIGYPMDDLSVDSLGFVHSNQLPIDPSLNYESVEPVPKRPREQESFEKVPKRLRLETKYYQTLFFDTLHYLSLDEISQVCSRAPIPIFIKNKKSVYLYINQTFCQFILMIARTEDVIHKTTSQVLGNDAEKVINDDQTVLSTQEGTINLFDVELKQQFFRVMKQHTTLRDGQSVIIGIVVDGF